MKIGFTGTRNGLTPAQRAQVKLELDRRAGQIEQAHHGGCCGGDEEFHELLHWTGVVAPGKIHVHWCDLEGHQSAAVRGDRQAYWYAERPPLSRNRDIACAVDLLIVAPKNYRWSRSGTWATYNYAVKVGVPVLIVFPDGTTGTEAI